MKLCFIILSILLSNIFLGQSEGDSFCGNFSSNNYFPLDIEKKKIIWSNTSYSEIADTWITIDNLEYLSFIQTWESGNSDTLFLRQENGVTYQYDEGCESETIRFKQKVKVGDSWTTCEGSAKYTVKSKKGKLNTPFCKYSKLIVIKAEFPEMTYKFYYKKGYGYVGATIKKDKLISFVTPKL